MTVLHTAATVCCNWDHHLAENPVNDAQESLTVTSSEELVEPTLVLQFPSRATSGMRHTHAAACATGAAAQAQASEFIGGRAQRPTFSTRSDCGTAQDCSHMAGSLSKHRTASQPEHVGGVDMMPVPCLQPMAAVSRCEAGGEAAAEHQQSDGRRKDKNALGYSEQPSNETAGVADGQNASTEGQATVPGGQATAPNGQVGSSQGQTTVADGQNGSPDRQATVLDDQHGSPREQTQIADGSAARTGQAATIDKQTALADGMPAVMDDTISEACCVCKSAQDGEVMLLCDKCDQPAHLGCVGVDTVPEGNWFCPSCTPAMVSISCTTQGLIHILSYHSII